MLARRSHRMCQHDLARDVCRARAQAVRSFQLRSGAYFIPGLPQDPKASSLPRQPTVLSVSSAHSKIRQHALNVSFERSSLRVRGLPVVWTSFSSGHRTFRCLFRLSLCSEDLLIMSLIQRSLWIVHQQHVYGKELGFDGFQEMSCAWKSI